MSLNHLYLAAALGSYVLYRSTSEGYGPFDAPFPVAGKTWNPHRPTSFRRPMPRASPWFVPVSPISPKPMPLPMPVLPLPPTTWNGPMTPVAPVAPVIIVDPVMPVPPTTSLPVQPVAPATRKFPELNGMDVDAAMVYVQQNAPHLSIQIVSAGSAYTTDFNPNRLRIAYDRTTRRVVGTPQTG